ncbi:MAG TPA: PAS domain S-box protein [Methanospirillum sp.]|nr:PAS domain S-box protein [Methanospirillum sp.]
MTKVLFVDDNQELCTLFQMFLEERYGFSVYACNSPLDGLVYLEKNQVHAIISDYSMPDMNGIDFLKEIRQKYGPLPFIMLTGADNKETAIEALNTGADFYQNKGEDLDIQILDIAHKIRSLIAHRSAQEALKRKDAILEAISYAAEQYLKGQNRIVETGDILSQIGRAAVVDRIYLCNIREDPHGGIPFYELAGCWNRYELVDPLPPAEWPDDWHRSLLINQVIEKNRSDLVQEIVSDTDDHMTVSSLLIIPINANGIICGYLVFETFGEEYSRTQTEVQTLRMAAEVIGAARYRWHIEEFYKSPVEEALLGVFLYCDGSFRYVNPHMSKMFGYLREELLKIPEVGILIHPDDRDIFLTNLDQTLFGEGNTCHFESTGFKKDGSVIYLEIYLTTVHCQGILCITGNIIDVTERRMIEVSLQESEQRYRRLAEQLDDLIIVIDSTWIISYLNPSASSAFGNDAVTIGYNIRGLFRDDQYSGLLTLVENAIADGQVYTGSLEMKIERIGQQWYDFTITPQNPEPGQISSIVLYFHNVSYRVEQEEELRKVGLTQLEINMEQFQILNDEIRNPLQVIKGLNSLQGGSYADQIDEQLSLINDLIARLDKAWIRSEKVHKFLLKHYQHGHFIKEVEE